MSNKITRYAVPPSSQVAGSLTKIRDEREPTVSVPTAAGAGRQPCRPWAIAVGLALWLHCLPAAAVTFEAFTEPFRKIEVAAAETGVVEQLLVQEGDRVAAGQVLARLDNQVLLVTGQIAEAARQSQGRLNAAEAECELRRLRLQRLESLRLDGHASQEELDLAQKEAAVAEANRLLAREQHRLDELECRKIEAMIERRTVRSPIDGVVTKVHREQQEYVSNTSPSVATVVQLQPLRVVFTLPTASVVSLKIGQEVPLRLADTGAAASGKIELVAPVTEAESGTVRVKVLVDNAEGRYRSGVRCVLEMPGPPEVAKPSRTMTIGPQQL